MPHLSRIFSLAGMVKDALHPIFELDNIIVRVIPMPPSLGAAVLRALAHVPAIDLTDASTALHNLVMQVETGAGEAL